VSTLAPPPSHYELLQVSPCADADVIEAAYRQLARKYHPDVNPAPAAADMMIRLNMAYAVLNDPDRRAEYDHYLNVLAGWESIDQSHAADQSQGPRRVVPLGLRGRVLERLALAA